MKAILSDIHGNLEALQAVLDDIGSRDVEALYNLGDTTGYGPNPLECIDLSREMAIVLMGNFDWAVFHEAQGFGTGAERSVLWTRQVLASLEGDPDVRQRCNEFLKSLPRSYLDEATMFVHGSPRNPLNEHLYPEDIYNRQKMEKIGRQFEKACFNGHTHVQGMHVENIPGRWEYITPAGCNNSFTLDGRKMICNVGSVGQPRDGDWRAGYVLFDGTTIHFCRVEYEIETTVKKIYAIPQLDNFLGDRLRDGR